jgi:hypothetical protein
MLKFSLALTLSMVSDDLTSRVMVLLVENYIMASSSESVGRLRPRHTVRWGTLVPTSSIVRYNHGSLWGRF